MPQPIGLIQLVSEEAMPSLLPVLSLQPVALVHIVSAGFEDHSQPIVAAAAAAGLHPGMQNIREFTLPPMPSIVETHHAVKQGIEWIRSKGAQPVINFTGGTKLMSIGAFYAAVGADVLSLYVDGDHEVFIDGRTGAGIHTLLGGDLHLHHLAPQLSVSLVVTAHGGRLRPGRCNLATRLPLARHLLSHREDEQQVWETLFGKSGAFARLERSREKRDWLRAHEIQFTLPRKVRELAEAAGLIVVRHGAAHLQCDTADESGAIAASGTSLTFEQIARLISPIQARLNFFGGGWWETAVAQAVIESGLFRDVQVGAEASKAGHHTMEEDILAIQGVQLAYFSCKRGSQGRLQRQLEEVDASARRLGGKLARKYLAVCHLSAPMRRELQRRAAQLRIRILEPHHIVDGPSLATTLQT